MALWLDIFCPLGQKIYYSFLDFTHFHERCVPFRRLLFAPFVRRTERPCLFLSASAFYYPPLHTGLLFPTDLSSRIQAYGGRPVQPFVCSVQHSVCSNMSESANMFSIRHSMYLNHSNWFSAICLLTELCFIPPCSPRHTTVTITLVSRRHVIIMQISHCCFCIWFAVTTARPTTGCQCADWLHASSCTYW